MSKTIFPPFGYTFQDHPDGLPVTEENISSLLEDMGVLKEEMSESLEENLKMLESNGFEIE